VAAEIFADRAYTNAGNLVARGQPGAVLQTADECVAHVQRMLDAGGLVSAGGAGHPDRVSQHLRAWRWTAGSRSGDRDSCFAACFGGQPAAAPASAATAGRF
jgi:hypothetical protein